MKLRIKGNSLRLRVSRTEMDRLAGGEALVERIQFTPDAAASLGYTLRRDAGGDGVRVGYGPQGIEVLLSASDLAGWMQEDQVGIYRSLALGGAGTLDVILEKDFPCVDATEEENQDTFPNPAAAVVC